MYSHLWLQKANMAVAKMLASSQTNMCCHQVDGKKIYTSQAIQGH